MSRSLQRKSILIIRLTAVGDLVMAGPVATAIKAVYPEAHISWVVHARYQALLTEHPDIDQVIPIDLERWQCLWQQKKLRPLISLLRALRSILTTMEFDQALDLQGNTTSGLIAWLSRASHRIALGSEGASSWFTTKTINKNLGEHIHIGSEYRYLVNQLGYSDHPWQMHLPDSAHVQATAANTLQARLDGAKFMVICPVSRWPQRHWPMDYWVQFILRIRGRYHLRTLIVGDDDSGQLGEKIAQKSGAIALCDQLAVQEVVAIIQQAALVVGIDTGYTHMGHAAKVPTVSIFGSSHPYAYVEHDSSKILYSDRYCSPCRKRPTCNQHYSCMRDITPDKLLTTVKPLMLTTPMPPLVACAQ